MIIEPQPAPARDSPLRYGNNIPFWEYFSECYVPNQPWKMFLKELHREVCDTIQAACFGQLQVDRTLDNPDGDAPFVVINIAPRVGKTLIIRGWLSWMYQINTGCQFILTGYNDKVSVESSMEVRKTITSQWYRNLFPHVKLGQIRQNDRWSTDGGGNVFSEGINGGLLGKGAGQKTVCGGGLAIDDPAKPDEALSEVTASKLRYQFENVLLHRRNSSNWCPVVCNAQRLADGDLPGHLIREYPKQCVVIKFQALVNGFSTIPETRSTASLLKMQALNPIAFSAIYQQEPMIMGGNMIKKEWFRYHDGSLVLFEQKIITCDTAQKADQHNDWTVLQCWGKLDGKAYLIDQVREKMLTPQMIMVAKAMYEKHNTVECPISQMLIEEAASGPALLQSLNHLGIPALGIKRLRDKVVRVEDILAFQMTGMVLFPRDQPWLSEFELELMGFRKDGLAPHDDQVDAWADGIFYLLGSALSIWDVLGQPANDLK